MAACALALLPGAATAATITVTTTADEAGDAGGDCFLLAPATYPLTLAGANNGGGGKKDLCHGGGGKDRPKTKGCEKVRKIP